MPGKVPGHSFFKLVMKKDESLHTPFQCKITQREQNDSKKPTIVWVLSFYKLPYVLLMSVRLSEVPKKEENTDWKSMRNQDCNAVDSQLRYAKNLFPKAFLWPPPEPSTKSSWLLHCFWLHDPCVHSGKRGLMRCNWI